MSDEQISHIYVLIRTDIPLASQVVQIAHATMEMAWRYPRPAGLCHIVVLRMSSPAKLTAAQRRIEAASIRHYLFVEPAGDVGATALATEPLTGDARNILRRYSLWTPQSDPASP